MNWLLVRGLSRETRHWENFPQILQEAFEGSRVFSLDLPGAGEMNDRDSPSAVSEITDILRTRWIDLRSREEGAWHLISMSLGGMVGMDWCSRFASDFETLALINSSASNLSGMFERLRIKNLPQIVRLLLSRDAVKTESGILKLTTHLQKNPEEIARRWARYAIERPVLRKNVFRQLWAARNFTAPQKLEIPVLILASKLDGFTQFQCSERLRDHFQCEMRVHETAGHDLPLDDPDWITQQILSWQTTLRSLK